MVRDRALPSAAMSRDPWHLHAVLLPCGVDPVDLWVAGGRLTAEPQDGAETLPGGWVLPGLEDGARADLVFYAADPRDDPEVLGSPSAVLVGGRRARVRSDD